MTQFTRIPLAVYLTLTAAVVALTAPLARAAATAEQQCQKGRYAAAAKYDACEEKATGAFFGGAEVDKYLAATGKCQVKYTSTWAKLQKKATGSGSTCDNTRYDTSLTGTVIDRLTGLQWEQKTDDNVTIHDKDNFYTWSVLGSGSTAADGTVHTTFLATLNSGGCFAGQCDWRLPTRGELQTIFLGPYECATNPCIDQAAFGAASAVNYWSSSTDVAQPILVWTADFSDGSVSFVIKDGNSVVRAVRGGL